MGFLAPWFLAGVAALGIPVYVHLLRHNVRPPRPVSSLMFFERGTQSSTRHRRLKHLLLLTLRCALVLLVVLAFANPFMRRSSTSATGRLLLIVLDRSFSMRADTRFADAKQQALALLAAKAPAQKAQIIALGGQVEVLSQPLADQAQLRSAINGISPGDGHGDFGELARVVRSLTEGARTPGDLHVFSDMQRSAMPPNIADATPPGNIRLFLHAVATAPGTRNWAIQTIEPPAELSDPKNPVRSRVRAVVTGFNTPAASKTVSLIVNGATIATRKVDVPANGRATLEFAPLPVAYGWSRCEVRVEAADGFPADDASLFAVQRSDPQRVLFVHAAGDNRSPLYFSNALDSAAQASYSVQSIVAEQTTDLDPSRYAFVVLSDTATLPSIFEHALAQYVQDGGGVLIALGPSSARSGHIPLWAGGIRTLRQDKANPITVGQVDFSYPALEQPQPVRDEGGWDETKFLYSAVVAPGPARVAMRLSDGTPLLIDRPMGQGRVVLFASGFDNLTNDLPLHPVFVAFVDRAARYLSGTGEFGGSRLVDSFIQLRSGMQPVGQSTPAEVIDPDGHRPLSLSDARNLQSFRLQRAGFYRVRAANGHDFLIGVNPDRRESDLEPLSPNALALWAGTSGKQPGEAADTLTPGAEKQHVSLWWWMMLLALAATIAETVLASRYMGTQRDEL